LYTFLTSPCVLHALPILSSSTWHPNNIRWSIQVTKLLIMQSSPASCRFLPISYFQTPSINFLPLVWGPRPPTTFLICNQQFRGNTSWFFESAG
jgi:hypothetical protein